MSGMMHMVMGMFAAVALPFVAAAQDTAPMPLMAPAFQEANADEISASFETALDAAFATGDFVGLSVAVVRGGETELLRSWGVVEAGGDRRVTPATVFRIASLSKGVAGSLAGMAMAEGLFSPDDPAANYAPGLALAGGAEKSLTLSHLLSHRTGLPPNAYDNLLEANVPVAEILPQYRSVKLICPVGACYSYQNIAFDIVGRALSSVYEQPYEALARQKLFWPLGMMSASFGEAGLTQTGNWARPHTRDRLVKGAEAFGPWRAIAVKPAYYRVPAAGGVNASLIDMTAWLKAQMGKSPNVLPAAALELIHAPRVTTPAEIARMRPVSSRFSRAQYGFGWRLYEYGGAQVIAHSGTVDGYAAQIAWLPDHDVGLVILANARSKRLWRILPTFLDLELGLSREDWLALRESAAIAGSK